MSSEFGVLLRRLRQASGLSQEALAETAQIGVSAIGAYERGIHSAPHRDTVTMLARALGLGAAEFVGREAEAGALEEPPENRAGHAGRSRSALGRRLHR